MWQYNHFYSTVAALEILADIELSGHLEYGTINHKKFFYEIKPLVKLAVHPEIMASGVFFLEQGPSDGLLYFGKKRQAIQSVYATWDGHQESLQMEYMKEKGRVSPLNPVKFKNSKAKGREFEEQYSIAVESSKTGEKTYDAIITAMNKKIDKRDLYRGMYLIVVIDDWLSSQKTFLSAAERALEDMKNDLAEVFAVCAVVGKKELIVIRKY